MNITGESVGMEGSSESLILVCMKVINSHEFLIGQGPVILFFKSKKTMECFLRLYGLNINI